MTSTTAQGASPDTPTEGVRTAARGGLANVAGAIVSAAANFGVVVVVARFATQADAGEFFTITSIFLVLEAIGRLGADIGLVYFISRWRALGTRERIADALRAAYLPTITVAVVLAVSTVVAAPWIAHLAGVTSGSGVAQLRLLAVAVPVAVAYNISLGATRGFGRMRPTVLVDKAFRPALQLFLVVAVLVAGWIGGLSAAWVFPYVVGLVLTGSALRAMLHRQVVPSRRWSPVVAREFWSFSLPRAVAGVAQLLLQRLDIVLVASIRGVTEAAVYTAATRFVVVGQFLNQAISAPVQPQLSAALATNAMTRAKMLYEASTAWLVLCCWPLFGLALTLAPLYVRLFGNGYENGAVVVVLISIALFVGSGVGLVDTVVIMAGRTTWNLVTVLLALAVNIGVDLALIPQFGLVGAAVGWLSSIVVSNLVPLALVWHSLGLNPFGPRTYAAYCVAGLCYVALPLAVCPWTGWSVSSAGYVAVAGSVVYVAAIWHWRARFDLRGLGRRRAITS